MKSFAFAALASCSLLGACLDLTDDPDDSTDPGNPNHPVDPPPPVHARGTYQLQSTFAVTAAAVLPTPAYDLWVTLHDFSTAPAHTLIELADAAGVPAVSELRSVLPDALESRLEGWLDDQLEAVSIGGVPIVQIAGELAALGETTLTDFSLASELALTADGALATHRLTKLAFALGVELPIAALPADVITATAPASTANGVLALGDHRFGLALGHYAWEALEAATEARYGADLRTLLGGAVNCPAVAQAVASKCVLGVCVGHRAQLVSLCERGLDEVVDQARSRVEAVRFDAIHLAAGAATLVDADADGTADQLTGGVWTAEIDASQGLRPVPASFVGAR